MTVLLAVTATGSIAQQRPDCVHPKSYADSIASFNRQPVIKGRVIFLGNSITQRANWQKLLADPTVVNRGIGGDATCGVLDRLDDVVKRKPSKLFLLIGINDMQIAINRSGLVNIDAIRNNYEAILKRLKAETPDTKIYVESVLPTNVLKRQNWVKGKPEKFSKMLNQGVQTLNPVLKGLAEKYGCTWVNLYDWFKDENNELKMDYTDDGIHPNEAGYAHLIEYLKFKKYFPGS